MTFDPIHYKTTTRHQWEDYAEGWSAWGPLLETWLGAATERMLNMAEVSTGDRVLDVAAGAGGQGIAAARRVGPSGHVLATDLSPTILEYASRAATAPVSRTSRRSSSTANDSTSFLPTASTPPSPGSASSTSQTASRHCPGFVTSCVTADGSQP